MTEVEVTMAGRKIRDAAEARSFLASAGGRMPEGKPVRVFISYPHDSEEHRDAVLKLASRLREEGIDAWPDRFEPHPATGWPLWMELPAPV